jgi:uncharacterized protein (TIGR02246 family)
MDHLEVVSRGTSASEGDADALLQLVADLDDAWNNRDARAFAALFEEDADFQFHTGLCVPGRAAIEGFWAEEVFAFLSEPMRHVTTPRRIRFVTDDVAIGDGQLTIAHVAEEQEQQHVHLQTEGTMLAVRRDDGWRISAIRLMVPVA